ncbi:MULTISPECIES: M16 family metallopeptidase [unclassified Campylobacter]|uniref:M16 family metallopeptidase n=1 Tax=unclassified Campylobacter TaxID=2593542 RepID=UPI0022E9B9BC|nr:MULTISPECIES: pitrilysin family protein [unclassified Campylobacter]MDA3062520.1 insulinase family protein [Campylobacter sp. JMF_14 EL1]MDA3073361.1 insulinase family protein [Campylobacter sp. JMF_10 EL2]
MIKSEILAKNTKVDFLTQIENSLPVASFKLVFKASGAVSEKINGLAKLTAKMLNEGTKSLGVNKFYEKLDIYAINFDIDAGFETFVIEVNSLKEHFEFALEMLDSLLKEPNFTDEILDKIKTQILGEIDMLKSEFDYIANQGLQNCLYLGTKLASPLIGDEASIAQISLENVKEFFASLDLANAYVLVVGDAQGASDEASLVRKNITKILENFNATSARELPVFATNSTPKSQIIAQKSEQAYIYFGAPFYAEIAEKYIANVALFILGSSGFGSRLMENIRVKHGLAYSVYARANFDLSKRDFWGFLQTKNENLAKAYELIKSEIANFVQNGVSESELESAKKFILGSAVLQKETMFKRANISANEYYQGFEFGEFERNLERTKNLDLRTLNEFIASHAEILNLSFCVVCSEVAKSNFKL